MDDMPAKVQDLRTSQKETDGRLDRLERAASTVITVKPGLPPVVEISSKPVESEAVAEKISVRTMLWILAMVVVFSLSTMSFIAWLVSRG